ncbi:MAG: hypothetical protein HY865_26875 [Chloroflexi bacterium]|nr:hypothetical protein [Chloroflexota bacterium]
MIPLFDLSFLLISKGVARWKAAFTPPSQAYYSFARQMVAMNDALKYLLTDHLGSTVAVTDSTGALKTQQRYLPFGGQRTNVPSLNLPITNTTDFTTRDKAPSTKAWVD